MEKIENQPGKPERAKFVEVTPSLALEKLQEIISESIPTELGDTPPSEFKAYIRSQETLAMNPAIKLVVERSIEIVKELGNKYPGLIKKDWSAEDNQDYRILDESVISDSEDQRTLSMVAEYWKNEYSYAYSTSPKIEDFIKGDNSLETNEATDRINRDLDRYRMIVATALNHFPQMNLFMTVSIESLNKIRLDFIQGDLNLGAIQRFLEAYQDTFGTK